MACGLFGFSGKNVPIIICLWRKSDLVSQPSSFWVPQNQRMLPRILDVPRRNFHGIFSWHGRSDADAWSESSEGEEWKCRFKSRQPLHPSPKSPEQTWNEARDTEERPFRMLKVLLIETRWINRICLSLGRKTFSIFYFSLFFFFFFSFFFWVKEFLLRAHRCC